MSHEQGEELAGLPLMIPAASSPAESAKVWRSGTTCGRDASAEAVPLGLGKLETASVDPEEAARRDEEQRRQDEEEERLRICSENDPNRRQRIIGGIRIAVFICFAGICGLLICTQLIQAAGIVAAWPYLARVAAWLTLGSLGFMVVASLGWLASIWRRYRRNRPITHELLDKRKRLRSIAALSGHQTDVKEHLKAYMKEFHLDKEKHRQALRRQGVSDDELQMMRRNWTELIENNRQDFAAWRASFESCFLGPLDRAANRTIREYAILVGVKTAICPYSILPRRRPPGSFRHPSPGPLNRTWSPREVLERPCYWTIAPGRNGC